MGVVVGVVVVVVSVVVVGVVVDGGGDRMLDVVPVVVVGEVSCIAVEGLGGVRIKARLRVVQRGGCD